MSLKKTNVSFRITHSDTKKIKRISNRLGIKESEFFRFMVRSTLNQLMLLQDSEVKGVRLLPSVLDIARDLVLMLDFDPDRFDQLLNSGLQLGQRGVDYKDLELLVLAMTNSPCAVFTLSELSEQQVDQNNLTEHLKSYFYKKYLGVSTSDDGLHLTKGLPEDIDRVKQDERTTRLTEIDKEFQEGPCYV